MELGSFTMCDFAGPFNNFGRQKYFFLAVDCSSRYCFTSTTSSTSDAEVLRCLLEFRRHLCGLPAKIGADNALFTPNSRSRAFLEENGVAIIHGHAYVSRSQSKAEKTIGSISRLIMKYNTERPSASFSDLVSEATIAYNSAPNDALPRGLAPRDVHFVRPPVSFLQSAPDNDISGVSRSLVESVGAARAAGREALQHDVAAFLRRQQHRSPTNYTLRLRVGDLCLKKRMTWPTNTPKKYGFRIVVDAFEIKARVATNTFQCESLISGDVLVLPGDHLIRVRGFDRASLRQLCARMEETAARNVATIGPRVTRSATAASSVAEAEPSVSSASATRGRLFRFERRCEAKRNAMEGGSAFLSSLFDQ